MHPRCCLCGDVFEVSADTCFITHASPNLTACFRLLLLELDNILCRDGPLQRDTLFQINIYELNIQLVELWTLSGIETLDHNNIIFCFRAEFLVEKVGW